MERRYKILYIDRCHETKRWSRTMRVRSFREQWLSYRARSADLDYSHRTAGEWFTNFLNCYDELTRA